MLLFNSVLLPCFTFIPAIVRHDANPQSGRTIAGSTLHETVSAHDHLAPKARESFTVGQGQTGTFMLAWPTISTFTLVKGWTSRTTIELRNAVEKVVERNPILTGTARVSGGPCKPEVHIVPGKHTVEKHDFVNEINLEQDSAVAPTNMNLEKMNETEILNFMDEFLAPIVPKTMSVIESIQSSAPLFGIDVIQLPHDYACYAVSMSHCVGDGVTYYNIMEEIDQILRDRVNHRDPIVWHPRPHEVFPQRFTSRDVWRSYGFPFVLGLLKNTVNMNKQRKSYIIVDKEKVELKRKELSEARNGYLSHNDIITAALCEANLSSDIFAFTMNMRDRHSHFGGNFHNEIPFFKKAATDPNSFRNILKKGYYYDTNEIPLQPFVLGQVGRISSLATVQKLIQGDGMEVVCHSMLSSFVTTCPT